MRDYTKIKAFQLADELTLAVYEVTGEFPRHEIYGLTSQLRRAASSVPANIVEGSSRATRREYLHFLHIARASLAETQYFIHLSERLKYLNRDDSARLEAQGRATFACLHGLINAVSRDHDPQEKAP